jgi:hypothetical protein
VPVEEEEVYGTRRRGRRRKQLLDDFKEKRWCWKLKAEAQYCTLWRIRFVSVYGPVLKLTTCWWYVYLPAPEHRFIYPGLQVSVVTDFVRWRISESSVRKWLHVTLLEPRILRWFTYFWKIFRPCYKFLCSPILNYVPVLHSTTIYNVVNLLNTIYSQLSYDELQEGIRTSRDTSMLIGFVTSEACIFLYPHNAFPLGTFGLLISGTREYKLAFLKQRTVCRQQSTLTSSLPTSRRIYCFTNTIQFHDGTAGHSVLSAAMMKLWKHLRIKPIRT